jgi:PhnB protein
MARSARTAARSRKAAPKKKSAAARPKRAPARAARKTARAAKAARKRPARVAAVPAAYGSLTPVLVVSPAKDAIEYYTKAFGAKATLQMDGPGGLVMHAELKIGDSILMLSDELPPMGPGPQNRKTPKTLGGTSAGVMLYVKNVDAVFAQAVAAGGTGVMPPMDMFWGDRYGMVEDPFGHHWSLATHLKDMTPKQMREAGAAAMAQMAQAPAAG